MEAELCQAFYYLLLVRFFVLTTENIYREPVSKYLLLYLKVSFGKAQPIAYSSRFADSKMLWVMEIRKMQ
jgi:hypothetical protein